MLLVRVFEWANLYGPPTSPFCANRQRRCEEGLRLTVQQSTKLTKEKLISSTSDTDFYRSNKIKIDPNLGGWIVAAVVYRL